MMDINFKSTKFHLKLEKNRFFGVGLLGWFDLILYTAFWIWHWSIVDLFFFGFRVSGPKPDTVFFCFQTNLGLARTYLGHGLSTFLGGNLGLFTCGSDQYWIREKKKTQNWVITKFNYIYIQCFDAKNAHISLTLKKSMKYLRSKIMLDYLE